MTKKNCFNSEEDSRCCEAGWILKPLMLLRRRAIPHATSGFETKLFADCYLPTALFIRQRVNRIFLRGLERRIDRAEQRAADGNHRDIECPLQSDGHNA